MKYSLPALTITAFLLSGSAVFAAPTATDVAAQTATGTLAAPTASVSPHESSGQLHPADQ